MAAAITAALLGWSGSVPAQVEANRATAEELQTVRGIGPVLAARIVEVRAQRPFAGWHDFEQRVPGVGVKTAQKLSLHGLRIHGHSYGTEAARAVSNPAPPPMPGVGHRPHDRAQVAPSQTAPALGRTSGAPPPHVYPVIPGLSEPRASAR